LHKLAAKNNPKLLWIFCRL